MSALPRATCTWGADGTSWQSEEAERFPLPAGTPFQTAKAWLGNWRPDVSTPVELPADLPFQGGIVGYWGYEALSTSRHDSTMPSAAFGWYDWLIATDHTHRQTYLIFLPDCPPATREMVEAALATTTPASTPFRLEAPFTAETPRDLYRQHVLRIQDYIRAGDCYQVNYTQAFTARYSGTPWNAYRALRQTSKTPFAAFMHYPFGDVLSLSPEQFIEVENQCIHAKPIKGTRPRHSNPARDQALAQELLGSAKDIAENVMITDLLRNDLGKHAETGSVVVESLCALESFDLVHHLVSTITARLRSECHPADMLQDAFPGGSITGAPKKRAMEIIEELELTPRSIYCGSIGYFSTHGRMDTNIAIRTLLCRQGQIRAWAGGGITIASDWEDEYQECFNKIGGILKTLEGL